MNAEVSKECINLFEKFLTDIIKAFPEYKPFLNCVASISQNLRLLCFVN